MTVTYKDGEVLAAAVVDDVTGFSSTNVGRGSKWKLLTSGISDHYAVLRKGPHTETFFTLEQKEQRHRTVIEVLQQVKDNLDDRYDELLTHYDNIRVRLDQYRRLGAVASGLRDASVSGGDEVKEIWIGNTLAWLRIDIYLDWTAENEVTYAE